ncbi:MAG: hypothetical protein Q9212_006961 [Teloschistes hypoglaucus]
MEHNGGQDVVRDLVQDNGTVGGVLGDGGGGGGGGDDDDGDGGDDDADPDPGPDIMVGLDLALRIATTIATVATTRIAVAVGVAIIAVVVLALVLGPDTVGILPGTIIVDPVPGVIVEHGHVPGMDVAALLVLVLVADRMHRQAWYYFLDDASQIDHAAGYLEGNHATRWNNYEREKGKGDMTFEDFGEFLLDINTDKESRSLVAAGRYINAKQLPHQSVSEFHSFLTNLENMLPPLSEEWRVLMFLLRLRPEIQRAVRGAGEKAHARDRDGWVEQAIRMENLPGGSNNAAASTGLDPKPNSNSSQQTGQGKRKRGGASGGGGQKPANSGPPRN